MKTTKQTEALSYRAPETEEIAVRYEMNVLSGNEGGGTGETGGDGGEILPPIIP